MFFMQSKKYLIWFGVVNMHCLMTSGVGWQAIQHGSKGGPAIQAGQLQH